MADTQGMLLTDKYLDAFCTVKNIAGDLLVSGRITKIGKDYVEIRDPREQMAVIFYETMVYIAVTKPPLDPYFGVGKVNVSNNQMLRISEYMEIYHSERREGVRVPVRVKGKMTLDWDRPAGRKRPEEFPIDVRNLSLNGLFFRSEKELKIGDRIHVTLSMPADYFELPCRIQRLEERPGEETGYGCVFDKLPKGMSDKLCAYLFRVQGEQIRRSRRR